MTARAVVSVGLANPGLGFAPLEEYESAKAWLQSLPGATVIRIGLDDRSSYLTSAAHVLDSSRLDEIIERLRIQLRLANLERRR